LKADIVVTQIVRDDQQDVGPRGVGGASGRNGENCCQRDEERPHCPMEKWVPRFFQSVAAGDWEP